MIPPLWLNLENMLGLLDYVTKNADTAYLEWPEGEKLSLRQAPDSGNWNVNLRTAGNWFEVEGEVRIDEQHVISMAQLLDLLAAGKSNYIRLNEKEYMQLGENLRRQLERLESLAVKERGKIKISQFNTPLLDKAVNGVLSIGCDNQLNELKDNITKSMKQEPPVPAMLQAELRDYQYEGFLWMVRQTGWKRFQNGECPLFLISLKAGGLGLNLTGANYVIHLDPWWNPAIEQQATDRAYRIGQERNVTVYRLIAQHTIEEKNLRLYHPVLPLPHPEYVPIPPSPDGHAVAASATCGYAASCSSPYRRSATGFPAVPLLQCASHRS